MAVARKIPKPSGYTQGIAVLIKIRVGVVYLVAADGICWRIRMAGWSGGRLLRKVYHSIQNAED